MAHLHPLPFVSIIKIYFFILPAINSLGLIQHIHKAIYKYKDIICGPDAWWPDVLWSYLAWTCPHHNHKISSYHNHFPASCVAWKKYYILLSKYDIKCYSKIIKHWKTMVYFKAIIETYICPMTHCRARNVDVCR